MNRRTPWFTIGCIFLAGFIFVISWLRREPVASSEAKAKISLLETKQQTAFPVRKRALPQRAAFQPPSANFEAKAEALAQQSYEVRMKFVAELETKSSAELFDLWRIEAKAKSDVRKLAFIGDALATRLREGNPDSVAVLREMQQFYLETNNDEYSRSDIAQILGQTATRETLDALLSLLKSTEQPEPRAWLLQQITKASQNNWRGQFHEDFTDPLGKAWQSANAQSDSLMDLGLAIASVGSPKGLELLFSQIKSGGRTVSEFEQKADDKAWVAFGSLEHVRNPAALPLLTSELSANPPDSITTSAAGYCLAKMGQPEATAVLLRWVQTNPADVSGYVTDWFRQMRDGTSVESVNAAVKQADFVNQRNKDALSAALTLWLSHRSENIRPIVDQ